MDAQLPDPTDWSNTPLAPLTVIDSLLRCQICKDFYQSAVLTTCSHTFCSVCIRRCLSADGACPSCRTPEQESRLRRNGAMQELVDNFVAQRPALLETARSDLGQASPEHTEPVNGTRQNKRKRQAEDASHDRPSRRTRSTRSSRPDYTTGQSEADAVNLDSDDDFTPQSSFSSPARRHASESKPDDGLVACPSCGKRMKEESVFAHLDNCTGEAEQVHRQAPQHLSNNTPTTTSAQALQRLPQLSYNLLKDNALRKKLEDLKIPSSGPRALLIKRHSEWLALWNANCDSNHPKSRQDLRKELDAWERSQGGRSANGGGSGEGIKGKEFEPEEYNRKHTSEFADLISQARASRVNRQPPSKDDEPRPAKGVQKSDGHPLQEPTDRAEALFGTRAAFENPYRRGLTAPPATGPLKVSHDLLNDSDPAATPPVGDRMALPPLTTHRTAPEPNAQDRARICEQPQPTINPLIGRQVFLHSPPTTTTTTTPTAAVDASALAPSRRSSLTAGPEPPSPVVRMWSGSSEARRGSADSGRNVHMFQLPGELSPDAEAELGA